MDRQWIDNGWTMDRQWMDNGWTLVINSGYYINFPMMS